MTVENKNTTSPNSSNIFLRPWGSYENVIEEIGYKVKKIIVKPHSRLSLQSHEQRSEHWIVVQGTAIVTVGEKEQILKIDKNAYIPKGSLHRLENKEDCDLVIIEVQLGSYLGEDDIKRYQDDYNRT